MAIISTGVRISAATQSTKQPWKASPSSVAKILPSVSRGGVPLRKRQKPPPQLRLLFVAPRYASEAIGLREYGEQGKKKRLIKGVDDLPRLPSVR